MSWYAFVGPALRQGQKLLGVLSKKSDKNPKTALAGLMGVAIEGYARYTGTDVEAARASAAMIGRVLVAFGQAMGG